jgi:hypothetical protein
MCIILGVQWMEENQGGGMINCNDLERYPVQLDECNRNRA